MRDDTTLALRPDLFGQLAATDPFHGRARRLYERGQVLVVNGNQADLRVGYDARSNPLDLKEVPIVSGYIPRVGDWVAIQYEAGHSGAPWVTGPSMAADDSEDPPGIGVFAVASQQPADPQKSTVYFDEPASTWRGWNGAAWVDLGGGGGGLHNSLPDLQGGAAGEYYHLTASQWGALVGNMPFAAGGVVYADGSGKLATDAANLSWDAENKRLGIGTDEPAHALHAYLPKGSTATPIHAGDGTYGFVMGGATAVANRLSPMLFMYASDVDDGAAMNFLLGQIDAASDVGTNPVFRLDGRRLGAAVQTRPVLGVWSYGAHLLDVMPNGQVAGVVGSAGAPTWSFYTYPTMGMYAYSASALAWSVGGAFGMALSADGLGIGISPAGLGRRLYVHTNYAGPGSSVFHNASTDAAAGWYHYWLTGGGGDLYDRYVCPGYQYWAFGIRQSDDKWVWSDYFDLSTNPSTYDRMTLDRNGVWWLKPHSPSLTADGEAAMDSGHDTFRWRMGEMECLGASLLDTARVSDATVSDSGGELAEQAISTCTIGSGFNTSGNAVKVVAKGTARVNPKVEGGGATMHIIFRIEGTNVLDLAFNAAQAQPATWIHYEFSFDATMRGSTSWEISNVKAEYATWQQVGNPWPCTFTPTLRRYGRDAAFTVSGDVPTQVRCSISNGAPGGSYITVAKHQAGLEQT